MNAKRKILAQGDRDGACFLYAIANGINAVRGKPITRPQWSKCIGNLPFQLDDFLAGRGTEKLDDNTICFELFCNGFLNTMDIDSKVKSYTNIFSSADMKRIVQPDSVMLAVIDGGDHWVAIVDVKDDDIYIACSAQALSEKGSNPEARSPRLNRIYNEQRKFDKLDLWKNYGLHITHKL